MPAGRITDYSPKYVTEADNYLATRTDSSYIFTKTEGNTSSSFEEKVKAKLPTIEGFAQYINISRKTLYNWEKDHPEFAAALEKIRAEQFQRLIDSGLDGTYNPTIAKLILSSNHGMVERIDETSKGETVNNFSDEQINRIAKRITARRRVDGDTASEK